MLEFLVPNGQWLKENSNQRNKTTKWSFIKRIILKCKIYKVWEISSFKTKKDGILAKKRGMFVILFLNDLKVRINRFKFLLLNRVRKLKIIIKNQYVPLELNNTKLFRIRQKYLDQVSISCLILFKCSRSFTNISHQETIKVTLKANIWITLCLT